MRRTILIFCFHEPLPFPSVLIGCEVLLLGKSQIEIFFENIQLLNYFISHCLNLTAKRSGLFHIVGQSPSLGNRLLLYQSILNFYYSFSLNKIQDESQVAKEENAQAKEKTQEDACKVQVDPHPTIFNFEDIL